MWEHGIWTQTLMLAQWALFPNEPSPSTPLFIYLFIYLETVLDILGAHQSARPAGQRDQGSSCSLPSCLAASWFLSSWRGSDLSPILGATSIFSFLFVSYICPEWKRLIQPPTVHRNKSFKTENYPQTLRMGHDCWLATRLFSCTTLTVLKILCQMLVVPAFNASILEAGAGGFLWVQG